MKEPDGKQIKEFWEWCGFRDSYPYVARNGWLDSEGNYFLPSELPEIDLNNLFKYAVPRLYELDTIQFTPAWNCQLGFSDGIFIDAFGNDTTLALFWAIYKVLEGE